MPSHVTEKCSFRSPALPAEHPPFFPEKSSPFASPFVDAAPSDAKPAAVPLEAVETTVLSFQNSGLANVAAAAKASDPTRSNELGDARWESMLQGLIEYKRQNNNLSIPRGYRWNNRNLYEFCRNQRKHYLNGLRGKTPALMPKRIERLKAIGFELDPTGVHGNNDAFDDQRWAVMFKGLEDYFKANGSFAVPSGKLCDGKSLHDWVRHQRKQFATMIDGKPALSGERIKRLMSLGFDLDLNKMLVNRNTPGLNSFNWTLPFGPTTSTNFWGGGYSCEDLTSSVY